MGLQCEQTEVQLEGVLNMIRAYELLDESTSSDYLDKLVKLKQKEKLSAWLDKRINS